MTKLTTSQRYFMLAGEYRYRTRRNISILREAKLSPAKRVYVQDVLYDCWYKYKFYKRQAVYHMKEERKEQE